MSSADYPGAAINVWSESINYGSCTRRWRYEPDEPYDYEYDRTENTGDDMPDYDGEDW